jgi:membrane dipeptidase
MTMRRDVVKALLGCAATARFGIVRAETSTPWFGDGNRLADLGMALSAEQRAAGKLFLAQHVSIDTHCHPGRFFLTDLTEMSETTRGYGPPFEERAIHDIKIGNLSAGLFSCIGDLKLAEMTPSGIHSLREFRPEEAYSDYNRQMAALKSFAKKPGLFNGRSPADVVRAHKGHETAAIFAIEGGDFIESHLDRIEAAFNEGVRAITIVHYHVNQIGDIQTESPVHNGLTTLGKIIVREMNRVGMIVDLAHAPLTVVKDVVNTSSSPVLLSHSNLVSAASSHPRLITLEHAKLVAETGGLVGAWPSGIGQTTFSDYIDSIRRLVDAVGMEHVGIGSDMDANFKPVFRNYADWSLIPAALLARGLHTEEVAAIMGGNFMRIFGKNSQLN